MADVKWIKLSVRLPDNRQLKQIRHLPSGDTIALMWVYLLCLAGEINDAGMIYFTPNIPYTEEMLADQFDMDVNTVRLGLETFRRFGMIDVIDNIMLLPSWEKWQAEDKMSEIREQTRKRVAKHREKQRLLASNVTGNVTVTDGNATEQEPEPEERGRKSITVSKDTVCPTDVRRIVEKWNELGLAQVQAINAGTERHKLLKKRIKDNGVEKILAAIERIQQSSFLKGKNESGWCITFDWFIKPNNFPKVAEGNYDDGPVQREGVKPATRQPEKKNDYNDFMAQLAAMRE